MRLLSAPPWLLFASLAPVSALPGPRSDQTVFGQGRPHAQRAAAVQKAFQWSWDAYYKHAFPHDSLRPLDKTFEDDRNGWGVTPIDALGTAIIMGEDETVAQILKFIEKIDFTKTAKDDQTISVFESTIRYLGGLLSAYDLLNGPKSNLAHGSDISILLKQAASLADGLKIAFDTPSGVPDGVVIFSPKKRQGGSATNSIAGFGTLVLEWTRLSDLTGNPEYANLTQRAEEYILRPKPAKSEPFPGMVGHQVSLKDGTFQDASGGWGGGTDSYYEYLIKMYLYDPDNFGEYKERWIAAADSTIKYLASHPSSRKDLTFLAGYTGTTTHPSSGHLACFSGGNFILGGLVLNDNKYLDFGLELTQSCYQAYHQTASGIGPEGFRWVDAAHPNDTDANPLPPADKHDFYAQTGFWASSAAYILRPETLESVYYAYRATGQAKWQDMAWEAFGAFERELRLDEGGYAGIWNVNERSKGSGQRTDHTGKMESFWLAETLKYLYLIFADDAEFQVQAEGGNAFVFNTEAHLLRVRGGK
ncbi:hypothetical protein G7046_g1385 [Stylonectria norvegica]|nr:hypothetical protein G7046_g1385 [Stylonectria norvegica]